MDEETSLQMDEEELNKLHEVIVEEVTVMEEVMEEVTGESEAQMLINKMENRNNYVPNFTFQYKVDNSELVAMFWADEVSHELPNLNARDSSGISCDSTESHQISLVIPFESYEISLESHVILVESQEILLESHVILLESHVILLLSQVLTK
ncbi:hypothetical protein Tco_0983998 [Tanacetum coccineum]